jgi:hypothetical protein
MGFGEGCDGGSIPTRIELVRLKQQPEQASSSNMARIRSRCCSLSNDPLSPPIVACGLGRLYNKDVVIEALLNKQFENQSDCSHIRSLKDVTEVKMTVNPNHTSENDPDVCPYICPITKVEFNGIHSFLLLKTCGHLLSVKSLKEIDGII